MILLGLGANLRAPDGAAPAVTVRRAAAAASRLPGFREATLSRLWDSAPVPPSGQPRYVNAVLRLAGMAEPAPLLAALHAIEARFGRVRGEANAARTLDIDILDLDGLVRQGAPPLLPHPRLAARAFVLLPLAEVAPGWRHPATGESVEELIAALPAAEREACRPLSPEVPPNHGLGRDLD